ncbi:MAG: transposase family protein [Candidatus Synoicihabitans palmerolidicus]|nr:transposase family protein [Candidatus Synoicihabitans palmerolidicus]
MPEDCRAGLRRAPTGTLPLKNGQLPSLLEALCGVPEPRAKNTRFKIGPVLGIVALALLAGRRDIASIARMANLLDQDQRFALALPREAGKKVRLAPSYSVFYDVLTRLDPEAFAQALNRWLTVHAGALPGALALAGKFIRDAVGVLSLVEADTGAPVALAIVDQKENTSRSEQARAGEVLAAASLDEQIVTPATPCTPPASRPAPSWEKAASMCSRSKATNPS